MTLIQRMTDLNARLLSLPQRFGLTAYSHVVRVHHYRVPEGSTLPIETVVEITPNPSIVPMSPSLMGSTTMGSLLDSNMSLGRYDYTVKDLTLNYTPEELDGDWEVDGVRGWRLLNLRPKETTYTATIRKPPDNAI